MSLRVIVLKWKFSWKLFFFSSGYLQDNYTTLVNQFSLKWAALYTLYRFYVWRWQLHCTHCTDLTFVDDFCDGFERNHSQLAHQNLRHKHPTTSKARDYVTKIQKQIRPVSTSLSIVATVSLCRINQTCLDATACVWNMHKQISWQVHLQDRYTFTWK